MGQPSIDGAVRTHSTFIDCLPSYWFSFRCPKMVTIVSLKSLITDHQSKYNNNDKAWNIERITKCGTETQSEQMLLEEWYK